MAEIIGISAGRKNKVTESVVKAVLEGTGKTYELISLSGKLIRPCEACNGCVKTNRCVIQDDFAPILEKLYQADGIVFGAPTYWDHMNAKGQVFWERLCFSGRHNAVFPLRGKPGIIVAVDGKGGGQHVIRDLTIYYKDAGIYPAGHITAQGEYACFSCGYGNYCPVGGFAELFPLGTEITKDILPSISNQHPEVCNLTPEKRDLTSEAKKTGAVLSKVVDNLTAASRDSRNGSGKKRDGSRLTE
ncbi:MAG: flavodoxin family protein [Firmicutes bacterium]|nr:flavodoxin family protein [Bacillota bacterium]